MRRLAHLAIVLACIALADCREPSMPPATTPSPLPTPPAPPPVPTHSLSGVVRDVWTVLPMPGVTVSVVTGPSRASTTTDVEGGYTLTNLVPGLYTVSFSKPLFRTATSQAIAVFADAAFSGSIGAMVWFPVTALDLGGGWVGNGPYRDEPLWLTLVQRGASLEGLYKDRTASTTAVTGTRDGDEISLRIAAGPAVLTIEARVLDHRCMRGVIKNEALGGNFPITFSRGSPALCAP